MLEQLGFDGGVSQASGSVEAVEYVVELNLQHQAEIQYTCHHLPQHLHQSYTAEVYVSLWYQDDGLPGEIFHGVTFAEVGLHQTNNFLPRMCCLQSCNYY